MYGEGEKITGNETRVPSKDRGALLPGLAKSYKRRGLPSSTRVCHILSGAHVSIGCAVVSLSLVSEIVWQEKEGRVESLGSSSYGEFFGGSVGLSQERCIHGGSPESFAAMGVVKIP